MMRIAYEMLLICLIGLCGGSFAGCRSSKKVLEETRVSQTSAYSEDSVFNAATTAEKTTETLADSSNVHADELGRVEIERDSAGRPTVIIWNYDWRLQGKSLLQTKTEGRFFSINASRRYEASGMVDSDSSKKEETETHVDPSIPLGSFIRDGLVGLMTIYVIYLVTVKYIAPCLRKNRQ